MDLYSLPQPVEQPQPPTGSYDGYPPQGGKERGGEGGEGGGCVRISVDKEVNVCKQRKGEQILWRSLRVQLLLPEVRFIFTFWVYFYFFATFAARSLCVRVGVKVRERKRGAGGRGE